MGTEENATNGGSVGGDAGACECAHGSGDSGEEELSVLPRHTKVVVTGNNRTKSVLVGLQGVVKKAVGLGGWHWLVLTNGIEVKLQRNALSVIEAPTGQEEEDDDREYQNVQCNGSGMASEDVQKPQKPRHRPHKIVGPAPKNACRSRSCDSKSKESVFPANVRMKVDLSKLETATLWRYWRHYNLGGGICPDASKEQLVNAVKKHFMSQVIAGFIRAAKRLKNRISTTDF